MTLTAVAADDHGDRESFDYEVPTVVWTDVTRTTEREDEDGHLVVDEETVGHKVEPPFDEGWDELTKLRWFAALIGNRTGVQVRVAEKTTQQNDLDGSEWDVEEFLVSTQHLESTSPAPYEVTWAWLSGLEAGIYEGRISG